LESFFAALGFKGAFFAAAAFAPADLGGAFLDAAATAGALATTFFFLKMAAFCNTLLTADFKTFLTVDLACDFLLTGFTDFFRAGFANFDFDLSLFLAMSRLDRKGGLSILSGRYYPQTTRHATKTQAQQGFARCVPKLK
jgi:hypothetical protein